MKRYYKNSEQIEDMKNEIEAAIQNLENNNPNKLSEPNPNQNGSTKTVSSNKFP
jgi:hypothetical protein